MLLAAAKPKYPAPPPEVVDACAAYGLAALALLAIFAVARSETCRRFVLGTCDPRVYAVLRIGFAIMTIQCFVNLFPYWRMLWSDEGLFDMAYARDRLGRGALAGYVPGEGFLDPWAVVHFLTNKPSLFFLYGSPAFVYGYMAVFFAVLVLYGLGILTRPMGVVAWFMMSGIYNRNALYWEGTDLVYRAMWFILLFARTDAAWSVDNWWRCRRLRRKGRLAEPGSETPEAEPVYRRVPVWPRLLMAWQLALIYVSTGLVKTGSIWKRGDALYYALNMDHFYRFEWWTQLVSYYLGTNLFRLMTWIVLVWERLFPLVLVGVFLDFVRRHRTAPWALAERRNPLRRWVGVLALVALWWVIADGAHRCAPYLVKTAEGAPAFDHPGRRLVDVAVFGAIPLFAAAYLAFDRFPIVLVRHPRRIGRWRIGPVRIDGAFLRRWLLGRRVYLGLGVCFHGFLILFMNIGMFPFIMLMSYAAFVDGEMWVRWIGRVRGGLRRLLRRPDGPTPVWLGPAGRPDAVRPKGGRVPDVLVLAVFAALLAYFVLRTSDARSASTTAVGWAAVALTGVGAVVGRLRRPSPLDAPAMVGQGPALVPSAVRRTAALAFLLWHGSAIALHLFPSAPVVGKLRRSLAIHGAWLRMTGTTQSWDMFAPNPPTANTFMVTVVVEEDGDLWDLRNNAYRDRPNPFWINDRMRKMQRRMVGKGKWYLDHWGAFWCREWTLRTGERPREIRIDKIVTRIPGPDLVRKKGPYHPRKLRPTRKRVDTIDCRTKGELPVYMRERYGLEVPPELRQKEAVRAEAEARKWENRRKAWQRRPKWLRAMFPSLVPGRKEGT
ncbi:MAG: hypothetical protein D6705_10790 [Deltaproteobacteria bacterium]|nr:MAG: hypothetical protein D6705_10790 [Deltaproteobacteria bacterium]